MKTDRKIIRLRLQQPLLNGNEIARKIGVCRQYVSKILQQAGLNNKQPRYKNLCKGCESVPVQHQRKFCSAECREKYYWIPVECSFCHYKFKMQRSHIIQRYNRGMQHIYCSNRCYCSGQKDGISKSGNKRSTFRAMGS